MRRLATFEDIAKISQIQSEIALAFQRLSELDEKAARSFAQRMLATLDFSDGSIESGDRKPRGETTSSFTAVRDYLISVGNVPKTKPELIEATRLSEGSLHSALYTEGRSELVFAKNPAGGKLKVICLKDDIYQAAKRGN